MNDDDPLERRRQLTFEEAEGFAPMPSQLARDELSMKLRSLLWAYVHGKLLRSSYGNISGPWLPVLRRKHVERDHRPIDEFDPAAHVLIQDLKLLFFNGSCAEVMDFLDWVLRGG